MPAIPNVLERLILITTNKGPGPALDLLGAGGLQALSAAIEAGIFEHLADHGPSTAEGLSQALSLDRRGTRALLGLLVPLGYLDVKAGTYRNTSMTERWILEGSPTTLGRWLRFWDQLVLPYLDEALPRTLRHGPSEATFYTWLGEAPGRWALAQATFEDLARVVLDEVVDKVPVPEGQARLLDIGGGHGLYAIGLCEAHPDLSATILDLPAPLEAAASNVEDRGLSDRIDLQPADYTDDGLGEGYDIILLFNVLHGHPAPEAASLVARAADALAPEGRLIVADQFPGMTLGPATRGLAGLMGVMYVAALGGDLHEEVDVQAWMTEAGLVDIEVTKLSKAPGSALLTARYPPDPP